MDIDITCKTILNSIVPNKIFGDMACEACSTKFTLFKRKKQCKDCMRFYCSDCVIKRGDRVLNCGNCSMLSRRPLIRSQVLQMKSKDIKHYLIAKKVSLRGCVEKEDLVNIVLEFANGVENLPNNERTESIHERFRPQDKSSSSSPVSSPTQSQSPPINTTETIETVEIDDSIGTVESPQSENESSPLSSLRLSEVHRNYDVQIEEIIIDENAITIQNSEPLVAEEIDDDPVSEKEEKNLPSTSEIPIWTGNVNIAEVNERSDLEYLNIKQLKDLLRSNRIDFRGCVEKSELLDRASRLWDAYNQSKEELNTTEGACQENLCKICWDSPIECVILECGHMACCIECGKRMNECPICRQYAVRVVRFFKA